VTPQILIPYIFALPPPNEKLKSFHHLLSNSQMNPFDILLLFDTPSIAKQKGKKRIVAPSNAPCASSII
jgi:hypothetical protein